MEKIKGQGTSSLLLFAVFQSNISYKVHNLRTRYHTDILRVCYGTIHIMY